MRVKILNRLPLTILICLLSTVVNTYSAGIDVQSIQKAKDTSGTKPTASMIIEKVNAGAELIAKEGPKAFPKFKGTSSDFIFAGTYIWIHSGDDGTMLMHPMKPKLEGKNVLAMKDKHGKLLFVEFNRVALEEGSGWVDYWWPKPGETVPSKKVSYVKLAEYGGKKYVIGAGVYGITLNDIQAAGL